MAFSDAVATYPRDIQLEPPIDTRQLDDDVLRAIVQKLDPVDDIWKLRILLCSVLPYGEVLSAENCDELLQKAKAADAEFNRLVIELLYTIKRYDLLKLTGNCKHRLKDYFNVNNTKLHSEWKQCYVEVEDTENMSVEEILQKIRNLNEQRLPSLPEEDKSNSDKWYQFHHSPCGFCVIVSNETFSDDQKCPPRVGTKVDEDNLTNTFAAFDFDVKVYRNLSAVQIEKLLITLRKTNYSRYDCFVCCILSHGNESFVYGSDCQTLEISSITCMFTGDNCPTLHGKPKLYFIQACQGSTPIPGRFDTDLQRDGADDYRPLVPIASDYLLSMATVAGYSAYRSKSRGSWFISSLTNALKDSGHDKNILEILTMVNDDVAKQECKLAELNVQCKQMPIFRSTLRKMLKFKRKREPEESSM